MSDFTLPDPNAGKTKPPANRLVTAAEAAAQTLPPAQAVRMGRAIRREMCTCPGDVPCVSEAHGKAIAARSYDEARRSAILQASFAWLLAPHEGVTTCLGITGRDLTEEELASFALEVLPASLTLCPYRQADGSCLLGSLGTGYRSGAMQPPYAFLPMVLAREWDIRALRDLMAVGAVPNAKTQFLTRARAFPRREDTHHI